MPSEENREGEIDLEQWCVAQPPETAWLSPYDRQWHQVRPGFRRKVYGPVRPRRIYGGAVLETHDQFVPANEIAGLVDKRPLARLKELFEAALSQVLYRAHCGDKAAIREFTFAAHRLTASLQRLTQQRPDEVREIARMFDTWPVIISLNPQDLAQAQQDLQALGVGTKSLVPTKPGQRIDRRNPWTRLVLDAMTAIALNKQIVPALKSKAAGARVERKTERFWGVEMGATISTLANGDVVIISDWQEKCVGLAHPITKETFNDWWSVVKGCVLEHWKSRPDRYANALKCVGGPNAKTEKRNRALERVAQALRSLAGMRTRVQ